MSLQQSNVFDSRIECSLILLPACKVSIAFAMARKVVGPVGFRQLVVGEAVVPPTSSEPHSGTKIGAFCL